MDSAHTYSTLHSRLIRTICDYGRIYGRHRGAMGKKHGEIVYLGIWSSESGDWCALRLPSGKTIYAYDFHGNWRSLCAVINGGKANIIRVYCDDVLDKVLIDIIENAKGINFHIITTTRECVRSTMSLKRRVYIEFDICNDGGAIMEQKGYNNGKLHISEIYFGEFDDAEFSLFLDSVDMNKLRYLESVSVACVPDDVKELLNILKDRIARGMEPIAELLIEEQYWSPDVIIAHKVCDHHGRQIYPAPKPVPMPEPIKPTGSGFRLLTADDLIRLIKGSE